MNEIEAISVLETRIKYPNSDTYGGMCESEYQQEAVDIAREALREKQERSKGCEYCKVLTPDCCGGFFLPSIDPDCEADMVTITHCPMCGKRLEEKP